MRRARRRTSTATNVGLVVVRRRDGTLLTFGASDATQPLQSGETRHTTPVAVPAIAGVDEIASIGIGFCYRTAERVMCLDEQTRRVEPVAGLP